MAYELLTTNSSKINKSLGHGYKTYILHMMPNTLAGVGNVCPKATAGCIASCLNTSGHGGMLTNGTNAVQEARKRRTQLYAADRDGFMIELYVEIRRAIRESASLGLTPIFRLNGTSDIPYESVPLLGFANIFEAFPNIQFYDYTKIVGRYPKVSNIPNYHLTFSRSEDNDGDVLKAIEYGMNIAIVFDHIPEYYMGVPVYNGDAHDIRFLDPEGHIIGLKVKGRGMSDTSGFVIRGHKEATQ